MVRQELLPHKVCHKMLAGVIGREVTWTSSGPYASDPWIDPPLAPYSMGDVGVAESCELSLEAVEAKIEEDAQRRNASNDPSGAEGSSAESTCDPSHGVGMDSFQAFDMLDNANATRRIPQSRSILKDWKNACLIGKGALFRADSVY